MIVEIPQGSRNKDERDHATGHSWLDRALFTASQCPLDDCCSPQIRDDDPLDALVRSSQPVLPGRHLRVRPVAVFRKEDENGWT